MKSSGIICGAFFNNQPGGVLLSSGKNNTENKQYKSNYLK